MNDDQLQFLQELVREETWIDGDVVEVCEGLWAIHGSIPVDGEVVLAEFATYEQAMVVLAQLRPPTPRSYDSR